MSASMRSWFTLACPLLLTGAYAAVLAVLPRQHWPFFHSEWGPVELLSATAFALAAALAALTALRLGSRPAAPWAARAWYWLFLAGAMFMFLEETSFGQHYWGYESPEFFEEHNKQSETNLHNLMGDKPSSTMRRIADAGFPIFAIALPLIFGRDRKSYHPGHWTWYILPRWELMAWVILAALTSPVRKLGGFSDDDTLLEYRGSLSEFKELLWAGALLTYGWCMWRRLEGRADREAASPVGSIATEEEEQAQERAREAS